MAFCESCGNAVTGAFCGRCGAPVRQPSDAAAALARDPYADPPGIWTMSGEAQQAASATARAASPFATAPGLTGPGVRFIGMWNWGAFLLTPWWLMNHGRVGRGILYLVLCLLPFVPIGISIAYGAVGNRVAVESGRFTDEAQFVAVQNAWRNWGFWVAAIALVLGIPVSILDVLTSASPALK